MDDQKLVMCDFPIALWLFGLAAGGYAAYAFLKAPGQIVVIAVGAGIFALICLTATILTVTADRIRGILTIRYTGLLIRKRREIPIAEIAAVELEQSRSSNSSSTYRIVVVTRNNERIPLRSYYSGGFLMQQARAKRLRDFLGVGGMDMSLSGMFTAASAQAAEAFRQEQESITGSQDEEHVTDGVRWKLQTRAAGGSPVSVWQSPDFQWPGHFLYLVQKMPGQRSTGGVMSLMGKTLLNTSMKIYGFGGEMTPGLERASQLSPLDPQLEPLFFAYTSDPAGARQILNPWVEMPLADWAQKYPVRQTDSGSVIQLAVLFSPQGVSLAIMGLLNAEFLEELTRLGVELVKAQGGAKA